MYGTTLGRLGIARDYLRLENSPLATEARYQLWKLNPSHPFLRGFEHETNEWNQYSFRDSEILLIIMIMMIIMILIMIITIKIGIYIEMIGEIVMIMIGIKMNGEMMIEITMMIVMLVMMRS